MNYFKAFLILCAIIILVFMFRKLRGFQLFFSLITGTAALLACDLILSFYGQNMPVNIYTICISSIGGLPGVTLLILLKTFMT